MPSRHGDGAHARAGISQALATVGGALLLILALLASLVFVVDIVGRYGAGRPLLAGENLELASSVFGFGFAGAALLALPAALGATFARAGDPPLRSHSALALVPGCVLALAISVIAIAVAAVERGGIGMGLSIAWAQTSGGLTTYAFLFIPIAIAFAAALGGARTPEATAAAAAPVVVAGFAGLFAEVSIIGLLLSVLFPLLAAAAAIAILYAAAPARAVTPWLAGIALALGMALLVATGWTTPTEAMGLIALFGLPIALLVRVLALRQPIGAILRQAATETIAIVAVLSASLLAATALLLVNRGPIEGPTPSTAAILIGGAAVFVASYLLTATLALGLALPLTLPILQAAKVEPTLAVAILVLLGLAAMAARAARRDAAAPAQSFPPGAAFVAAAAFVALAVAAALVPDIVLAPARAILN
jgi:hypothetical protein